MRSEATNVEQYLSELPEERKQALQVVRDVILKNLPSGYEEVMNWGMITYQVPLATYPDTYNKQPLAYAALASQKHYMAVYLSSIYLDSETRLNFEAEYRASGKRYDAGKSCVRFRNVDDLPLLLIGKSVAMYDVKTYVDMERLRVTSNNKRHAQDKGTVLQGANKMWKKKLELYDKLVAKCPRFERKGKTVPYTSAKGHMFSLLNKDGELGIRFSKEVQEKYIQQLCTTIFKSHGAVMKGYVLIPDNMLEDLDKLSVYLNESYDYVMSLESK